MNKIKIPRLFLVLFLAGVVASCRDNPDSKKIAEEKKKMKRRSTPAAPSATRSSW
jgi:hypothetical protein